MKISPDLHKHREDCIFCPLKKLFAALENGAKNISCEEHKTIVDDLTETHSKKISMRQISFDMNNPCEAFEKLLNQLNKSIKVTSFDILYVIRDRCSSCKKVADIDKKKKGMRVMYLDVEEVLREADLFATGEDKKYFESIIKTCSSDFILDQCLKCKKPKCEIEELKYITSLPFIITLAFRWKEKTKKRKRLYKLLKLIFPVILPVKMFYTTKNYDEKAGKLVGFITVTEDGEYVAFHYDHESHLWFQVCENDLSPVGSKWKEVRKNVFENELFPVLLFFEVVNRKHDIIKYGYKEDKKKKEVKK